TRNAGTKKLWITSCEVMVRTTVRLTGTCSSSISRLPSACCNFHIHCLPTTCTSIAFAGRRSIRKYVSAPQENNPSPRTIAPIVQPPSSNSDPELGWERLAFDPRLYLTEKKMIGRKMIARKKSDTAMSAKKSASTSCDIVEPCGGKRRNWSMANFIKDGPPSRLAKDLSRKELGALGDRALPIMRRIRRSR